MLNVSPQHNEIKIWLQYTFNDASNVADWTAAHDTKAYSSQRKKLLQQSQSHNLRHARAHGTKTRALDPTADRKTCSHKRISKYHQKDTRTAELIARDEIK